MGMLSPAGTGEFVRFQINMKGAEGAANVLILQVGFEDENSNTQNNKNIHIYSMISVCILLCLIIERFN